MILYRLAEIMIIQIDTREHKNERQRIEQQFDALGIKYYNSKLYVGDYMSIDNPRLIIDRKKDIGEIYSNVVQGHERFVAELLRAQEVGIQLVILCEHGADIQTLVDVIWWENPRRKRYRSYVDADGKTRWFRFDGNNRVAVKRPPLDGKELYDRLVTMQQKYNIRFEFCDNAETGKRIAEILGGEMNG